MIIRSLSLFLSFFLQPYSIVHGVLRVELIQVAQGGQYYVNQNLIEMGFADETEESALSKVTTELIS